MKQFLITLSLALITMADLSVKAQSPWGTRDILGTVLEVNAENLTLRLGDGTSLTVKLLPSLVVGLGQNISRQNLMPRETVAVAAAIVPIDNEVGYIARSFLSVDPSLPNADQALAIMFIQKSHAAADDLQLGQRAISGRLRQLVGGMVLEIQEPHEIVSVKLGPEADGYRLRPGRLTDLVPDAKVLVPLWGEAADRVLVFEPR